MSGDILAWHGSTASSLFCRHRRDGQPYNRGRAETAHSPAVSQSTRSCDLETEVGVQLLTRSARGVELPAAGRAFLDHARLALAQAEAAIEAARRVANPARPGFALGFLTGQEMDWLPEAMRVLRDVLPEIEVTISSQYSPLLGEALTRGILDLAFMRAEPGMPDLTYQLVAEELLVAVFTRRSPPRRP